MTIVTASVDKVVFQQEPSSNEILRIKGIPIYVGSSSIECRLVVEQLQQGIWKNILCSNFTMVALDKLTNKPKIVHKLEPISDIEKKYFEFGKGILSKFIIRV